MKKQVWRCQKCGHEFYTLVEKKQAWYRRIFLRREAIACEVCKNVTALRKRVIKFKDKENEEKDVTPFDGGNFTAEPGSER